jgi:hypothetical protein
VPKRIPIGIALYVISVVAALRDGWIINLILGAPFLLYQGALLYGIYKRQNWARIALLVIVLFVLIRMLPSYGFAVGIGHPAMLIPIWAAMLPMAYFCLKLIALVCFFSREASRWFLNAPPKAFAASDAGWPAEPPHVESSNFGFGSTPSIRMGILVAGFAILGYYVITHALHSSMPTAADSKELAPGDAKYPVETANPTHVIPFIVTRLGLSNYKFNAEYGSDVNLCGHEIAPGGYFSYTISIPIEMAPTLDGPFRGSITIDKFQPGKCGWKFKGMGYTRPDGVGNALGTFKVKPTSWPPPATPHIDMWCYRVTDGQFKSREPKCEILAMLRWPDAVRRASPEFLAQFSHEQLDAGGAVDITTETKDLTLEFHDLNAIPGALIPVGDTAAQVKASEEARAAIEASPEGKARQCFTRANLAYAQTRPAPDTATVHTQRDAVLALRNKCRADFGLAPVNSE